MRGCPLGTAARNGEGFKLLYAKSDKYWYYIDLQYCYTAESWASALRRLRLGPYIVQTYYIF